MLERLMFWAILGHFVGDYLLQSKKMAIKKSEPGWVGAWWCGVHCWYYSLAMSTAVIAGFGWMPLAPGFALILPLAFASHYPIDRWSLGGRWLKLIRGRPLVEFQGIIQVIEKPRTPPEVLASQHAFAAIVYTVVDNTLHILLMLAGFAVLLHWEVIG